MEFIDDYKRLFEIKYEGGWSDEYVWYAKCKFCDALPIFNIYNIKNWNNLNIYQRKKRFYSSIIKHIKTIHPELILPKRKVLEQQEIALNKALHFLKNFPFRPHKEEEPMKIWKPGTIVLPHSGKEKKKMREN
jgi:hypothetical protein